MPCVTENFVRQAMIMIGYCQNPLHIADTLPEIKDNSYHLDEFLKRQTKHDN